MNCRRLQELLKDVHHLTPQLVCDTPTCLSASEIFGYVKSNWEAFNYSFLLALFLSLSNNYEKLQAHFFHGNKIIFT